jgi:hypothetical protein
MSDRKERQKETSNGYRNNCEKITTLSGKPFGMPQCEWDKIQAEKKRIKRPKVRKTLIRVNGQMVERDDG